VKASPSATIWCHLALAALLFRALLPDGYMLTRGDQGAPAIVPCPARSPELVQLIQSQAGHQHHHHHGADDGAPGSASAAECPFAAALLSPPSASLAVVAPAPAPSPPVVVPAPGIARLASLRTPPATGPPSTLA